MLHNHLIQICGLCYKSLETLENCGNTYNTLALTGSPINPCAFMCLLSGHLQNQHSYIIIIIIIIPVMSYDGLS
jgi:hypothetical protein